MSDALAALLAYDRADAALRNVEAEFRWLAMEGADEPALASVAARVAAARERRDAAHRAYFDAALAMHAYAVDKPAPDDSARSGS